MNPALTHEERYMLKKAQMGLAVTAIINIIGMPLELYVGRTLPHVPSWPPITTMFVAVTSLALLALCRSRLSFNKICFIYLLNTGCVALSHLLRSPHYAEFIPSWVPFQTSKLGCMIVALTSPNFLVGLIGILLHSGFATLSFFLLPHGVREGLAFGEPIPIFAFAMGSLFALIYRTRQMKFELELQHSLAEGAAIKSLAEAFLHLRDLMNTPLQTIELSVALLKEDFDKKAETLDKISRALKELSQLNKILTRYEKKIDWRTTGPNFFNLEIDQNTDLGTENKSVELQIPRSP